jgi:hypothetical protein
MRRSLLKRPNRYAGGKAAMGYQQEKAEAKRQDLEIIIADALRRLEVNSADHLAGQVVREFVSLTAPYWDPPPLRFMTLQPGGLGGGSTTKPGNVTLNLRKLVRAIASGALTIGGAIATPWMLLVGALLTWDALWSCLRLEIGEDQACVLWTLWSMRDDRNTVAKAEIFEAVTRERQRFGKQLLSAQEVDYALHDLARMRCIKSAVDDPGRWWLREWVRVAYH